MYQLMELNHGGIVLQSGKVSGAARAKMRHGYGIAALQGQNFGLNRDAQKISSIDIFWYFYKNVTVDGFLQQVITPNLLMRLSGAFGIIAIIISIIT